MFTYRVLLTHVMKSRKVFTSDPSITGTSGEGQREQTLTGCLMQGLGYALSYVVMKPQGKRPDTHLKTDEQNGTAHSL